MSVVINARVTEALLAAVRKAVELRSATFGNGTVFKWTVSLYVEEALRSALRKDGCNPDECLLAERAERKRSLEALEDCYEPDKGPGSEGRNGGGK